MITAVVIAIEAIILQTNPKSKAMDLNPINTWVNLQLLKTEVLMQSPQVQIPIKSQNLFRVKLQ